MTLSGTRCLPVLIILAGLAPSAWLLFEFRDTPQLGSAGDDVMYIGAAQSLATIGSYRELAFPGSPWQTKYPPGYPLMLAAILRLHPAARDFWLIAHSWIWLALASFALGWAMFQAGLSLVQAAMVAALWAANPAASSVGTLALADAPYCAVIFLALGFALRIGENPIRSAALVGALIGVACLIRSAGIVAGGALFAWMLWRKKFRTAIWFSAFAAAPATIWMLWSRAHLPAADDPITSFYFNYGGRWVTALREAGLSTIILTNIHWEVISLGGLLIAANSLVFLRRIRDFILVVVGTAALTDWEGGPITAVAIAIAGFQLVWHWPANGRFLLLVSPAFLGALVARFGRRPRIYGILSLAVVAVADMYGTFGLAAGYASQREEMAEMAPAYRFITDRLPADAVILGDGQVWLATTRQAVSMPMPMEYWYLNQRDWAVDSFFMKYEDVASRFGAGYILVTPWDGWRGDIPLERREPFFAALRANPNLERLFSQEGVELFKIRE